MNQLKFVRSKSTAKCSPLGRSPVRLYQVPKPGKQNISVGKKSANNSLHEKKKVNQTLTMQKNQNSCVLTPDKKEKLVPLSHEKQPQNSQEYQIYGILREISNKRNQPYFEFKQQKQVEQFSPYPTQQNLKNIYTSLSSQQNTPTETMIGSQSASNFYSVSKDILKQSLYSTNNQHWHQQQNENQQVHPYEEIVIELSPQFINKCYQNKLTQKPIIEQVEEEDHQTKQSTQQNQQKLYTDLKTENSLPIIPPKIGKDMEIQTSIIENSLLNINNSIIKQDKCKIQKKINNNKNFGIFQFQFSYISPKNYQHQIEKQHNKLDCDQSLILQQSQNETEKDNTGIRINEEIEKIYLNNQEKIFQQQYKSQLLSQQNTKILQSRQQLLDPFEDSQHWYLQADPNELFESNNKKYKLNLSNCSLEQEIEKQIINTQTNTSQCYKNHLNILLNQSVKMKNKNQQDIMIPSCSKQSNLRNSEKNQKGNTKSKQNTKKSTKSNHLRN